jgi:hypothetical protein
MRYVLIRGEDGAETMIPESPLPAEKDLHDVLTQHAGLLPADDLELLDPVVVGREANLESGYADLVLVDQTGQICLVEVKNEGNPDTRRVIAQLLDYAAALWQLSVGEFAQAVLAPFLEASGEPPAASLDIAGYVRSNASSQPDAALVGEDVLLNGLEQSLASGRFRLVVAAPLIPQGVEKVMEYLNAQGHTIYGLEVGFFSGSAECFVPRLVVKPRVSEIRSAGSRTEPVGEAEFLDALPAHAQVPLGSFLKNAADAGVSITWNAYGPAMRPARLPARVVAFAERGRVAIIVTPPKEFLPGPFELARAEIDPLGLGMTSANKWEHSVKYEGATEKQLTDYLAIAAKLLRALSPKVTFLPLAVTVTARFERNDNNIWSKGVGTLSPHTGSWLRGTLNALGSGPQPVILEPLKGGQPGWLPRFADSVVQASLWPPNIYSGTYELSIDATAEPDTLLD